MNWFILIVHYFFIHIVCTVCTQTEEADNEVQTQSLRIILQQANRQEQTHINTDMTSHRTQDTTELNTLNKWGDKLDTVETNKLIMTVTIVTKEWWENQTKGKQELKNYKHEQKQTEHNGDTYI